MTRWMNYLSDYMAGDYCIGEKITIGDLFLFHVLDNYMKPLEILSGFPKLQAFRDRMAEDKKIADYLASDRRPAITFPQHVGILCTPEECK